MTDLYNRCRPYLTCPRTSSTNWRGRWWPSPPKQTGQSYVGTLRNVNTYVNISFQYQNMLQLKNSQSKLGWEQIGHDKFSWLLEDDGFEMTDKIWILPMIIPHMFGPQYERSRSFQNAGVSQGCFVNFCSRMRVRLIGWIFNKLRRHVLKLVIPQH